MEEFENLFKIPKIAMKINRSDPYVKKDKKWMLQFLIYHGYLTFTASLFFYNVVFHDLNNNGVMPTCRNAIFVVVYIVTSFQYFVLVYHRKTLVGMIEDIKKDFEHCKNLPMEEQEVMTEYARKGVRASKQWLAAVMSAATTFLIKNIALFVYYYWIGEFRLVQYYDLIYPEVVERNKDNLILFWLLYILLMTFDYLTSIMYIAFTPLGLIFMLHACGQLELVKRRMLNIFNENDDAVIMTKLGNIVKKLQDIYRLVQRTNECFMLIYELSLKASTVILPIALYEVLISLHAGEIKIEFVTFITSAILFVSAPCYYSDFLMEKGEDVRLAIYSCGWEAHSNLRVRSTLLIMLVRALKPTAVRSMFRVLCLDALTDVFRQSYALFNLMNAMWN